MLERYATRFDAVEINSSFHRPHRPATYRRWCESVPADFRFSVKVPKTITHEARLVGAGALLDAFLSQAGCLGDKLGCLLVQLPPSLALDRRIASSFLRVLRARFDGHVALEPRHASWFEPPVQLLLERYRIARVAADPPPVPGAAVPAGSTDWCYRRLHGSPQVYYSSYDDDALTTLASTLRQPHDGGASWVIFDNTALGHATANALRLQTLMRRHRRTGRS